MCVPLPMITIDPPSSPFAPATLNRSALSRFLKRACDAVDLQGEVHVLLTSDAELKRLNRTFRGKNKPTDVLSFPAATEAPDSHNSVAGDLAISLETAARQAAQYGHSLRDEVRILLLHGTLHLGGYDHEIDSGEMAEREAELRRQLRLPTGLIARTEAPAVLRKANRRPAKAVTPKVRELIPRKIAR
ncbi:MAG: hypothetical protein NVSMB62_02470 [Acidobacteriaceae bacterium]